MSKKMECPICQKATDDTVLAIEYEGKLYAFCCLYCRERFVEEYELDFIHPTVQQGTLDARQ